MSNSPKTVAEDPQKVRQKPKGKLANTDLSLNDRDKTDTYNRKNAILWTLSICLMLAIVAIFILFMVAIFTNHAVQSRVLDKLVDNIVVIATFAFAIFGIQTKK